MNKCATSPSRRLRQDFSVPEPRRMMQFRGDRERLELGPFTLNFPVLNGGDIFPLQYGSAVGGHHQPPFQHHSEPPSPNYDHGPPPPPPPDSDSSPWPYRCNNCPNYAKIFCPRCEAVGYCSEAHLMDDEINHKLHCNPEKNFTEVVRSSDTNEVVGMRSTNNLSAGDSICKIRPFMMSPHDKNLPGPVNSTLCFGCCKWFPVGLFKCSLCGWPVCSIQCEANSLHSTYECEIFHGANVPPSNFPGVYDVILVLRVALMLENSNHEELIWQSYLDWNAFKTNTKNESAIRPVPEHLQSITEDFLLKICRLSFNFERNNSAEFIRQVLSYVHANSICQENRASAFDCSHIRNYHSAKYIFPYKFAYAQHCNPNTNWTINYAPSLREASLHIWLVEGVSVGDKLTACFDQSSFPQCGTHERRALQLLHFQRRACNCPRCSDPTELGSMASAVKCRKCMEGYLLPVKPLEDDSVWKCANEDCAQEIQPEVIFNRLHAMVEEIQSNKNCVGSLLGLIRKYKHSLHPQHYLIARAAERIVELGVLDIRSRDFQTLNMYNFKPFIEAANICLNFADAVSPGLTKHRAKYIYALQLFHGINEAHNAAHHFSKDEFVEGRLVRQKMEKIHLYQTEFYKIAQFEKVGSCMHEWRTLLQKSKDDLGELLRTTARKRPFDGYELERLKRAMSYFCASEYEPNLPADLRVDVVITLMAAVVLATSEQLLSSAATHDVVVSETLPTSLRLKAQVIQPAPVMMPYKSLTSGNEAQVAAVIKPRVKRRSRSHVVPVPVVIPQVIPVPIRPRTWRRPGRPYQRKPYNRRPYPYRGPYRY